MIVMVMGNQNDMDWREFLEGNGWVANTFRSKEGNGTGAVGINGVGENITKGGLNKDSRVVNDCTGN